MNAPIYSEPECQVEEVAAYLDGELGGIELESFETHLVTCTRCSAELRSQRQLLCTLDVAFGETRSFELPRDFTRVIAVHAESDLSGMSRRGERRRAFQVCVILALASFALLGAASGALVWEPLKGVLRAALSVVDLLWRTAFDAATGAAVILRMVGRALLLSPYGFGISLTFAFVLILVISLLPRLIATYHRTQIIE